MARLVRNIVFTKEFAFNNEDGVYELKVQNRLINWIVKLLLKKNIIKQYKSRTTYYSPKYLNVTEMKVQEIINHLINHVYDYTGKPVAFMMGEAQFCELEHEVMQLVQSTYRCELQLFRKEHDRIERRWKDIEIIINPFIDGIVPLNKDMLY